MPEFQSNHEMERFKSYKFLLGIFLPFLLKFLIAIFCLFKKSLLSLRLVGSHGELFFKSIYHASSFLLTFRVGLFFAIIFTPEYDMILYYHSASGVFIFIALRFLVLCIALAYYSRFSQCFVSSISEYIYLRYDSKLISQFYKLTSRLFLYFYASNYLFQNSIFNINGPPQEAMLGFFYLLTMIIFAIGGLETILWSSLIDATLNIIGQILFFTQNKSHHFTKDNATIIFSLPNFNLLNQPWVDTRKVDCGPNYHLNSFFFLLSMFLLLEPPYYLYIQLQSKSYTSVAVITSSMLLYSLKMISIGVSSSFFFHMKEVICKLRENVTQTFINSFEEVFWLMEVIHDLSGNYDISAAFIYSTSFINNLSTFGILVLCLTHSENQLIILEAINNTNKSSFMQIFYNYICKALFILAVSCCLRFSEKRFFTTITYIFYEGLLPSITSCLLVAPLFPHITRTSVYIATVGTMIIGLITANFNKYYSLPFVGTKLWRNELFFCKTMRGPPLSNEACLQRYFYELKFPIMILTFLIISLTVSQLDVRGFRNRRDNFYFENILNLQFKFKRWHSTRKHKSRQRTSAYPAELQSSRMTEFTSGEFE